MNYKIERKSPYEQKKISFGKKVRSKLMILFVCGTVAIMSGRFFSVHQISKDSEQYKETISHYDELVDTTASYMKQYCTENPESYFELYTRLLWNGQFSSNRTYEYNSQNENNIAGYYGARIATGKGDCKANEDFFYKIMRKLGYNVYQVACSDTSISSNNLLFGNHIITVIDYEDTEYYFDTTNACSYQKVGINHIQNKEKRITITLRPLMSYIYGYNDEEETIHLLLNQFHLKFLKSGEAFLVNENLANNLKAAKKVMVLRKAIEPNLQNICNTIVKEG